MTSEILNLQIGNLSNYVGSHWWNLQEATFVYEPAPGRKAEIDHDVMFREGRTLNGDVTYTPRLIAFDLQDNFGSLKPEGVLYDLKAEDSVAWSHDITLHKIEGSKKNEFLLDMEAEDSQDNKASAEQPKECSSRDEMEVDESGGTTAVADNPDLEIFRKKLYQLDDEVQSWSDYLRVHLHPKSLNVIKHYQHTDDFLCTHGAGSELLNNADLRNDIEDRMHFFTEECDHLQGFHLTSDIFDGFGGLCSRIVDDLRDDFPKKGILAFCPYSADSNSQNKDLSVHSLINTVLSVVKMVQNDAVVTPLSLVDNPWNVQQMKSLSLPWLDYKAELPYHTGAVYATAIDTATLSHRVINGRLPMAHLTDTLSVLGRQVTHLSVRLPFPVIAGQSLLYTLKSMEQPWYSLSPLCTPSECKQSVNDFIPKVQSVILRGAGTSGVLNQYLQEKYSSCSSCALELLQECNTQSPFPHIFDSVVDEFGCINELTQRPKHKGVSRVACMTSLASNNSTGLLLGYLHEKCAGLTSRQLHKHTEAGLEMDEWKHILDNLHDLTLRYDVISQSSVDSEDDV